MNDRVDVILQREKNEIAKYCVVDDVLIAVLLKLCLLPGRHLPWHEEIMSIADRLLDGMLALVQEAYLCTLACPEWVTVNMLVVAGDVTTRSYCCNNDIIDPSSFKFNLR